MTAANGLPILLRNPCNGPTTRFGDQLLDFGDFELAARHDFPQGEVAFLALEFLVVSP